MAPVPLYQRDNSTPLTSSPSSSPNSSSDKENPRQKSHRRFNSQMESSSQGPKRRRLAERASNVQTQAPPSSQWGKDKRYYDPDQDEDERRRTRKGYRDLAGDFNGMCRVPHLCVYSQSEHGRVLNISYDRRASRVPAIWQRWYLPNSRQSEPSIRERQADLRRHHRLPPPS